MLFPHNWWKDLNLNVWPRNYWFASHQLQSHCRFQNFLLRMEMGRKSKCLKYKVVLAIFIELWKNEPGWLRFVSALCSTEKFCNLLLPRCCCALFCQLAEWRHLLPRSAGLSVYITNFGLFEYYYITHPKRCHMWHHFNYVNRAPA